MCVTTLKCVSLYQMWWSGGLSALCSQVLGSNLAHRPAILCGILLCFPSIISGTGYEAKSMNTNPQTVILNKAVQHHVRGTTYTHTHPPSLEGFNSNIQINDQLSVLRYLSVLALNEQQKKSVSTHKWNPTRKHKLFSVVNIEPNELLLREQQNIQSCLVATSSV
jgi:hypothetical protein